MRIAIVSNSDSKGGAARVALALAQGLRARGHDAELLVTQKHLDHEWIRPLAWPAESPRRTLPQRALHRLGLDNLGFDSPFPRLVPAATWKSYDVIHLHDSPAFNWARFPWLASLRPTLLTLHTPAAFTGNCLYPPDCTRFRAMCGQCPAFGQFPLLWLHRDSSRAVLAFKRLIARVTPLRSVIGSSEWITDLARQSLLGRFPCETIGNAVDTEAFRPQDRSAARRQLGLPTDSTIILHCAASDPRDRRKGLDLCLAALPLLQQRPVTFLLLGIAGQPGQLGTAPPGVTFATPAHVSGDANLALHYAAADVVWHPSRADNAPLVVLEAMASARTVIASRVGGVPDLIGPDGGAGVLIDSESPAQLAAATDRLFTQPDSANALGVAGRQRVERYFTTSILIESHLRVYERLVGQTGKNRA